MSDESTVQMISVGKLKKHPDNPRTINPDQLEKLRRSIREFPEMLQKRPLVVVAAGKVYHVLGGNMRLEAASAEGIIELPCIVAKGWSKERQREFMIKDNISSGEWDFDALGKGWDTDQLDEWGLSVPDFADPTDEEAEEQPYTRKVEPPVYEPRGEQPALKELFSTEKTDSLLGGIDRAKDIPDDVRAFLRLAAHRHTVFNYKRIADYYAHAPVDIQRLMEDSVLVIIDFDKAIEGGFVRLNEDLRQAWKNNPRLHEKEQDA